MDLNEFESFNDGLDSYINDISSIVSLEFFKTVLKDNIWIIEFIEGKSIPLARISSTTKKLNSVFLEFFQSARNTLISLFLCAKQGNFSDANMLLRKYRDDLFQYLFILEALNNKQTIPKELLDNTSFENFNFEDFFELCFNQLDSTIIDSLKSQEEKAIDLWFENTLKDTENKYSRKKYFDCSKYKSYLCKNSLIDEFFKSYADEIWCLIDRKLNNYTHCNGRKFIVSNCIQYLHITEINDVISELINDISYITSIFLSVVGIINPLVLSADNYINYLEMDMTPPDNCQYWLASGIQDYIDKYVVKINPSIKIFLKEASGMEINLE